MGDLWLIRHGETPWTVTGRHTGRSDVPLTPRGERQATLLGRRLAGRPFSLVLTSPLARARETCRLAGYGDVAVVDERLVEWDYGAYEGLTRAEIRRRVPDWTVWTGAVPGGESAEAVVARLDRVVARALEAGGDVALFSHGHALRALATRWLGLPLANGRLLALDTASLSLLGQEHECRVLRSWNQCYDLMEVP